MQAKHNDQLECVLTAPPLSSVSLNLQKAGYQTAETMNNLFQGKKTDDIIVDPIQVVRRQSTDIVAVGDADVSTALRFIREHTDECIQIMMSSRPCVCHAECCTQNFVSRWDAAYTMKLYVSVSPVSKVCSRTLSYPFPTLPRS